MISIDERPCTKPKSKFSAFSRILFQLVGQTVLRSLNEKRKLLSIQPSSVHFVRFLREITSSWFPRTIFGSFLTFTYCSDKKYSAEMEPRLLCYISTHTFIILLSLFLMLFFFSLTLVLSLYWNKELALQISGLPLS